VSYCADADRQAAIDDSDFDDDDRDDGLWSDTEFDIEEPEPEMVRPSVRHRAL